MIGVQQPTAETDVSDPAFSIDGGVEGSAHRPSFGLWAWINAASVLFCVAWLTGVPGLVMALLARSDWAGGHLQRARKRYKLAVILGSLSLIWAGLIVLSLIALLIVSSALPGVDRPLAPPSY